MAQLAHGMVHFPYVTACKTNPFARSISDGNTALAFCPDDSTHHGDIVDVYARLNHCDDLAVGSIRRRISSFGLYACLDSSCILGQIDVEEIPAIGFSKSFIPILFLAAFLDMVQPAPWGTEQFHAASPRPCIWQYRHPLITENRSWGYPVQAMP